MLLPRLWRLNRYAYKIVRQRRLAAEAFLSAQESGQTTTAADDDDEAAPGATGAGAGAGKNKAKAKGDNDLLNLYLTRQGRGRLLSVVWCICML